MSRKTRRKIARRKRERNKSKKKNWFCRWADKPITNRFTRLSTWFMLIVETAFLIVCAIWASIEIFLSYPELIERLRQIFGG